MTVRNWEEVEKEKQKKKGDGKIYLESSNDQR